MTPASSDVQTAYLQTNLGYYLNIGTIIFNIEGMTSASTSGALLESSRDGGDDPELRAAAGVAADKASSPSQFGASRLYCAQVALPLPGRC